MGVAGVSSSNPTQQYSQDSNTDFVQLGESRLSDVADRLGIDPNRLAKANPQIQDTNNLTPGQEIHLPKDPPPVPLRDSDADVVSPAAAPASNLQRATSSDPTGANMMKAMLDAPVTSNTAKPDEYVPLYPITPSVQNSHEEKIVSEDVGRGDVYQVVNHTEGHEKLNGSGLEDHLTKLNGGGPLTPFEKGLAAGWGKEPSDTTLTPIIKIGDRNVQAYELTKGGSGDRVTTYYDRQGNVLAGPFHSEQGLVNEGLGPIDYILMAGAAKNLIGGLLRAGQKMLGREGAEILAKGAARGEGEAAASGAGKSAWREGSGTSIYNPKPPSGPPLAGEFNEAEIKDIKALQDEGMTRGQAEDVIRRRGNETVEVVNPNGPNGGGTTRLPSWKTPGAGKKTP